MANVNATDRRGGLHERRIAAGLSQQRLAELAGCSLTFVRVLEAGYEPVTSAVLPRILAVLDAPPTQLEGVPALSTCHDPAEGRVAGETSTLIPGGPSGP